MKLTKLFILLLVGLTLFISCKKDETEAPFDHAAQAVIDEEILQTFLKTHYYTAPEGEQHFGRVDTLKSGKTPLISQVITKDISYADIDFKYYVLKVQPEGVAESPSKVDSVLINYKGLLLTKVNDDEDKRTVFDKNNHFTFWADLYGKVIPGWSYALTNYKSGINNSLPDSPLSFDNTGKGIFFLPSGLAYQNAGSGNIPPNSPLMFHVEVAMVKRNDQDFDGIKSIFEDVDNDGDLNNDDTDNDKKPNFIDFDDDNDGLSTKYEQPDNDKNGKPDDAIDTDNDGVPNFLDDDDDNDGILTKNENADPDKDGNPDDAVDSDGDLIPDYLDNK